MCSIGMESVGLGLSGLADAKLTHWTVVNTKNSAKVNVTAVFLFIKNPMVEGCLYPFADSHEATVFQ